MKSFTFGPIDLHDLSRLSVNVHGCFGAFDKITVVFVKLGGFAGDFACLTALIAVFHPQ